MRRLVVVMMWWVAQAAAQAGEPWPAGRAKLDEAVHALRAMEAGLPRITAAAEAAAERYVAGDTLAVRGGGLAWAVGHCSGGLADDLGLPDGEIVTQHTAEGVTIIVGNGRWELPRPGPPELAHATSAALAWTFRCELFAACTRLGKVPVLRTSAVLDPRQRRLVRYRDQRFHHDVRLDPIAPGEAGRAYLRAVAAVLHDVGTTSWPAMVATSEAMRRAVAGGGHVRVMTGPAYVGHQLAHCNTLTAWVADTALTRHDVLMVVGHEAPEPPRYLDWHALQLTRIPARTVWLYNGPDIRPGDIPRGGIHLDPQWPLGDGLVRIPGYDVRLGPALPVVLPAIVSVLDASWP